MVGDCGQRFACGRKKQPRLDQRNSCGVGGTGAHSETDAKVNQ